MKADSGTSKRLLVPAKSGVEPNTMRSRNDRIAVVYAVGPIMDGTSEQSMFGGATVGGDTIVAALRKARASSAFHA